MIQIRIAEPGDQDSIWQIIQQVIAKGDTYVFNPDSSRKEMLDYWCGQDKHTYVAENENTIVGTFIIRDNFPDLGSHVANASYMTLSSAFGKGIGRAMAEYSLQEARLLGYRAMQFNMVVKNNERAIGLWNKLGFKVIGEVPEAFNYRKETFVDAFIMWRKL